MPRLRLQVRGVVQGVGFRPFVYRLAHRFSLTGWVRNRPEGVEIEIQGETGRISAFRAALENERPAAAHLISIETELLSDGQERSFSILDSALGSEVRPSVPPDLAVCLECEREIADPGDRRYRYPFTNCTHCGPRYSLIAGLPYDRSRTGMAGFPLCEKCRREYEDPLNRRFHAEPVACPECGPHLRLVIDGRVGSEGDTALREAAHLLDHGRILALQGLGGFQLLVDATSEAAVQRLRQRKHREEKPFAVMFRDLGEIRSVCEISPKEAELLTSPAAPILLLQRKAGELVPSVAPENPRLGVLLPYTPLHRLLLDQVQHPLVCTSGNISEEPMAITETEALEQLGSIADAFLVHDRPILRPVDDSVVRMDSDGPTLFRRARGYAPLAHPVKWEGPPILALGSHQKSTVTLVKEGEAVVSQHLGDLQSLAGVRLLERTVEDLLAFLGATPGLLACDAHPDYASTRLAERLAARFDLPLLRVQHHHAHVGAVMAEHGLEGPVLGLAWDGSGWGSDGTVWGGEALVVEGSQFQRLGHLRTFALPGGDRAVKDPRRCAAGLLWEVQGSLDGISDCLELQERYLVERALERGLQAPRTSSIGRLFDAVSALLGLRLEAGFEGQAAMALEFQAQESCDLGAYPFELKDGVADFSPMLEALLQDRRRGLPVGDMARRYHQGLAELVVAWARMAGHSQVVLCGGCFQNRLLTSLCRQRLETEGFQVVRATKFPSNDGGISLGQAWVALVSAKLKSLGNY